MKNRAGIVVRYAPLWAIVVIMLLLFFSSTIPAIRDNQDLLPAESRKKEDIKALRGEIRRVQNKLRALEVDPITVENELRRQFQGAKREGELSVEPAQ
jgi:hypothetical protein